MWNQDLRLPVPPTSIPANVWASHLMSCIFAVCTIAILLYGLVNIRQHKGRIILVMLAAGLLTTVCEPILDVLEACYHPEIHQTVVFELMGRQMPLWVVLGYGFYYGVLSTIIYLAYEHGVTRLQVFLLFLIPVIVDIAQEEFMLRAHLYYYYGNQPLRLFGVFSYSWPPINAIGEFVGVTAAYLLMPLFNGWRALLVPLIVIPIGDFVGGGAAGMLVFNAVNTQYMPYWMVQIFGFTSWPLALAIVYGIASRVAVDSPARMTAGVSVPSGKALLGA